MPRKPAWTSPNKAEQPAAGYGIGDVLFFACYGTTGEAIFVGQLRDDPAVLVLAIPGQVREPFIEIPAEFCSVTGRSDPHSGRAYRDAHVQRFRRKLLGNS
jgi:hypothetical protein